MSIILQKALPRATNREEMEAVEEGSGPLGNERLLRYNIFLTDAFTGNITHVEFFDAYGAPDQIDGIDNDDSYRRSRHLLNTTKDIAKANENMLREN